MKRLALPLALTLCVALGAAGAFVISPWVDAQQPPTSAVKDSAPSAKLTNKALAGYTCELHPQIVTDEPGECIVCGLDLVEKLVEPPTASTSAPAQTAPSPAGTIYTCGMHPQIVQDGPGTCPICGMDLTPKEMAGGGGGGSGSVVTIDPVVVQNMGVRIKPVTRGTIFRHVRTLGSVDVAEDEISVVNLRYSGWIEKIHVDETGVLVEKGDPLFQVYSPELVAAQHEYILAVRTGGIDSPLAKSAQTRLEFWDMNRWQISQLAKRGKAFRTVTVAAPKTGYVLHKNAVQGARVKAGSDVYRIGNLANIWVNADVYEFDSPWIAVGQSASMELSFQPGKRYEGKVSYIHPTLNPKTRTLTVRIEFENPGLALKPGMFATVEIEAQRKEGVLALPTEAILHSGQRQVVFVAKDVGRYEMREISTGMVGDRHVTEVLEGLEEGERVVTSGQFLLDSESQLQEAVQKLLAARLHAKEKRTGGGEHDGHDHGSDGSGDSYYTCGMHPQIVQDGPGTCPICGMDLTLKGK